jgi:hypothetical protein
VHRTAAIAEAEPTETVFVATAPRARAALTYAAHLFQG